MVWGAGELGAGNEIPSPNGSGGGEEDEGSGLIVPTTETSKHTFFLQLALQHGIPFGNFN